MKRLKPEFLKLIRDDLGLAKKIADVLEIGVITVIRFTYRNSRRFTEISALEILSNHSGLPVNELIEVCAEGGESVVLDGTDEQGKKLISELQ